MKKLFVIGIVIALVGVAMAGVASAIVAPPITNHLTIDPYITLDVSPSDLDYSVSGAGDMDSQDALISVATNGTWWRKIDWTELSDGAGHTIPNTGGGFEASSDLYGPISPGDTQAGLPPDTAYMETSTFTFDYDGTYAPGTYTGTITIEAANT